ncbi:hypothetical protein IFM89_014194 [Coptis chinensis]|uniref:CCHC-type domain-containing protein n=1 Tax=Coptis chinensis TaxID=261450 RepID=A0A835IWQ6_9MAGN|nr:hypothetical protein IFM89_014194 [Coptis chinensis]
MPTFQFNPMSSPNSNLMHSPDSSPVNIFYLTKPINESTLDDYVDLTKEIPKKPKRKRKPYKKKRCNVKDFESQSEDEYIVEPTMDPHLESTGEAYVIDINDETIHVEEEIEFQSQSEDTHDIGANDVDVDNDRCFYVSNGVGPYMTQETCYMSEKESDEEDEDWDYNEEEASDDDISKLELVSKGEMDVDIQIDEFVKSTRNLYEAKDNERIEDPALGTTNFSLTKGMTWRTILECRKFMKDMAIAQKFSFKQKKNDKTRYKLVCKDPECKWFVNCSRKVDGHTLKLRLFNPTHTCEGDKNNKNVQAKAPWVANELEDFARAHPTFAPVNLHNEIYNEYGVLISYWTAWRTRVLLLERINGYIYPVANQDDWDKIKPTNVVLPPPNNRNPGRPKKQRIRGRDEEKSSGKRKCRRCGQVGHNTRTCKQEVGETSSAPPNNIGRGVGGSSTHAGEESYDSIVDLTGEVYDNSTEAQTGEGNNSLTQAQTREVVQVLMCAESFKALQISLKNKRKDNKKKNKNI